jgi:UDP-N-acetylmuramyl-tripeptide synthetase
MALTLTDLFPQVAAKLGPDFAGRMIAGVTSDSRAVERDYLFVALAGVKGHGLDFAQQALTQGAMGIIGEPERPRDLPAGTLYFRVKDPRHLLAVLASRFHAGQPKTIVAVTGTAGKSSVAEFTRQIFSACGHEAASLGTLGVITSKGHDYGSLTTPDPVSLHGTLDALASGGITHLAMEASSHGLDQRRLDGVKLKAAGFTNLGRDHLDYHATVEEYLAAKLRLFDTLLKPGQTAVINADGDRSVDVIATAMQRGLEIFSVGRGGLDLKLIDVQRRNFAQTLTLEYKDKQYKLVLPLVGDFQAENALVAAGLALVCDMPIKDVVSALRKLTGVSGRLERVGEVNKAPVFVDYAHKPEALEHVLKTLKPVTPGRLVLVMGCGGDRDKGKRPIMGRIAVDHADRVIVTDDNPRSELPATIRAEILAAAHGATEIGDRAEAINTAVAGLARGDALVIAGKGHETGQIIQGVVLPFSDHEVARAAIVAQGGTVIGANTDTEDDAE